MSIDNPFEDLQRRLEKLFGAAPGSFNPMVPISQDKKRVDKALANLVPGQNLVLYDKSYAEYVQKMKSVITRNN